MNRSKIRLGSRMRSTASKQANMHRKPAAFKKGDLIWIHLRKERFPSKKSSKLKPRANGHLNVFQQIGENAYKIDLLGDYDVSATFNVSDLSPYYEDQEKIKWTWGQVLFKQGTMTPKLPKIQQAQSNVNPSPKTFLEDHNNNPFFFNFFIIN